MSPRHDTRVPVFLLVTALTAGPVATLVSAPPPLPDAPVLVIAADPADDVKRAKGRLIGPGTARFAAFAIGGPDFAAGFGQAGALTAALAGHPWQIDSHMLFFAFLVVLVAFLDIPTILLATVAIALAAQSDAERQRLTAEEARKKTERAMQEVQENQRRERRPCPAGDVRNQRIGHGDRQGHAAEYDDAGGDSRGIRRADPGGRRNEGTGRPLPLSACIRTRSGVSHPDGGLARASAAG